MPLRPLIFDHGWLKLVSLVLAALIWFAVHDTVKEEPEADPQKTREFLQRPILLLAETTAHQTFLVEPSRVDVFLQGPAKLLDKLKEQDIQAFVRLTEGRPSGAAVVRVHVPAGVTVSHVDPLTVILRSGDSP